MCGIAGYLNLLGLDESAVLSRLTHRGPDGLGSVEIGPGSRLLHARLSIIDLSEAGRQPMRDPRTGNVIVFNGEIYNYRDLRRELDDGEEWASHSDTEVVLRVWRQWGVCGLTRLRGMFAFAIWDASARKLVLARDRFGIKPLYFARRGKAFAFASEVRALMAMGVVERRIDAGRLGEYLRFQSALGGGALVEGRRPEAFATRDAGVTARRPEAFATEVAAAFDDAVRVHLEADVPVGAFLSGGLDSAAIVGTMRHIGVTPKTFTVCWDDGDDESVAARRAAELAGAEHHEVRLSHAEVLAMVPEAVERMDSPSADGVNSYIVSWAVRQQVSMAHGLEVRVPFLDGVFAEGVLGLRDEVKFDRGISNFEFRI